MNKTVSDRIDEKLYVRIQELGDHVTPYCEKAVRNNYGNFIGMGSQSMRNCSRQLSRINGLNVDVIEIDMITRLGLNQELSKIVTPELSERILSDIGDISTATGLTSSEIRRACYLFQVEKDLKMITLDDSLTPFYDEVNKRCHSIRDAKHQIRAQFYVTLLRCFVLNREADVRRRVKENKKAFEQFAITYKNKIYNTEHYGDLIDDFGSRAFTDTENFIAATTDLEFKSNYTEGEHREDRKNV